VPGLVQVPGLAQEATEQLPTRPDRSRLGQGWLGPEGHLLRVLSRPPSDRPTGQRHRSVRHRRPCPHSRCGRRSTATPRLSDRKPRVADRKPEVSHRKHPVLVGAGPQQGPTRPKPVVPTHCQCLGSDRGVRIVMFYHPGLGSSAGRIQATARGSEESLAELDTGHCRPWPAVGLLRCLAGAGAGETALVHADSHRRPRGPRPPATQRTVL
jgi:hypothetical protein